MTMIRCKNRSMPGFLLAIVFLAGCNKTATPVDSDSSAKTVETTEVKSADKPTAATSVRDGVIVYYFHGNRRCPTCVGIQNGISKTVAEKFGAQQAEGIVAFEEINIEEEANRTYADKYRLASSTMVVSILKDGKEIKWTVCDGVWRHALDKAKLTAYVEEQIREALAAAGQ